MSDAVVAFGDPTGVPRILEAIGGAEVVALVRAEIRPEQEEEMEALASASGLEMLVHPRHTSPAYPAFVERIRALAPVAIVVDSYSMLLRSELLEIPSLGALNVHFAPLPRYRGPNPTQWSIINDERGTGVTLHHMNSEFDAGDIVGQRTVPIGFTDTWVDVNRRLSSAAQELLDEQLPRVLDGTSSRRSQDESEALTVTRRSPDDGRFEWSWSVLRIYNMIRALVAPLPGAWYICEGAQVTLDRYHTLPEVVRMKFGEPAGFELRAGALGLIPQAASDPWALAFELEGARGSCSISLDPDRRQAELALDVPTEHAENTRSALAEFTTGELGLELR